MLLDCVDLNSYLTYVYLHLQNSLHNKAEERLKKEFFIPLKAENYIISEQMRLSYGFCILYMKEQEMPA